MRRATQEELLSHYAAREVRRYLQLDGFGISEPDDFMRPDADGHALTAGVADELRASGPDLKVRVQIHESTEPQEATAILAKLLDWLRRDGAALRADLLEGTL